MSIPLKPSGLNAETSKLVFNVGGMDCGSCANTIKTALDRLAGVADVNISVTNETLSLTLDETATTISDIESKVRKLGFEASLRERSQPDAVKDHHKGHTHGPGCDHDHDHGEHKHDAHSSHDHGPDCGHDHDSGDQTVVTALPSAGQIVWNVEGMDCASCAATIQTALERVPGVTNIQVSVTNETLRLNLDETQTDTATIENKIAALGYKPSRNDVKRPVAAVATQPKRWWQTTKARIAITSGVLLAAAYIASLIAPDYAYIAFLLAAAIAVAPIARRAFAAASAGAPFTIEMLMTIASIGALFIGAVEEAAVVVFLFAVGEVLEGLAASKARAGIKALGALVPKTALVEDGQGLREIPAEMLTVGQTVVARTGDRIPADGDVIEGMSSVDESPITGESVPRLKEPGSPVYAGSINQEATLRIRVNRAAQDNTIARIIALVEEAQDSKAPTERFIDRFSRIYMPFIVGVAILVALLPPLFFGGDWWTWTYRALALLLIGCPCALVISVPAAIASSLSSAAKHGLLIKGGAVIEALANTDIVTFDKTGTLTRGQPVVTEVVAADGDAKTLIAHIAALERESSHPLAKAIVERADADAAPLVTATNVRGIAGKGVEGHIGGSRLFVGAPRFALEEGSIGAELSSTIDRLEAQGKTVVVAVTNGQATGVLALRDEPRDDTRAGIAALKAMGIKAVMLTGDNKTTAAAIASELGMEAKAELMPENKVEAIRALSETQKVVMVGDGINDAPALAAAHVGVAMGGGTDVALEAADAALLRNRVTDVATLIGLSRATMGNIRQNVAIALGLKALFLVTTIFGLTGLWIAVFADTGATVLVTLNAMRLLGFLKKDQPA